jgi:hypothetical protein
MESFLWLIYWIGVFLSLFPVTWAAATDFGDTKPNTEGLLLGLVLAFCTCWFWPLAIIGVPVVLAVKHWSN